MSTELQPPLFYADYLYSAWLQSWGLLDPAIAQVKLAVGDNPAMLAAIHYIFDEKLTDELRARFGSPTRALLTA